MKKNIQIEKVKGNVPDYWFEAENYVEYYDVFLANTQLRIGYISVDKDGVYDYVITVGEGYDDEDHYNDELNFLKHIDWIFNQSHFEWRYHY